MSVSETSLDISIEETESTVTVIQVEAADKNIENAKNNAECSIAITAPGTSSEIESQNQPHNDEQAPELLQSLEDLNKQIIQEQKDLLKQYVTSKTLIVSKHEIGVGSDLLCTVNASTDIPENPNYPPPPYSFHRIPDQQVYVQHSTILNPEPAPNYFDEFNDSADDFGSTRLRNKFVTKVYGILTTQLLISFGFVAVCVYVVPVNNFVKTKKTLYIVSFIVLFVLLILLACFTNLRRAFPINFIMLLLLTLAMTYTTGATACFYSEKAVLVAMGSTAAVLATVSFIAWLNLFDVTSWGFAIFMALILFMLFAVITSVIFWILGSSQTLNIIFASVAVVVFTFYLLYDTQKLLGGGRIELSPEEYILGALSLYVDVMLIFYFIMMLCNRR